MWEPNIAPGEGVGDLQVTPPTRDVFGSTCWSKELKRSRGSGPWGRRLFLYTVWCGRGGLITYRSSSVRTDHDTFCWNHTWPQLAKTFGGANFTLVEVQAWVEVACASIPTGWPNYHDTLLMRIRYLPNGVYRTVAS